MKRTIGLVLVCCLSSQVYAGLLSQIPALVKNATLIAKKAETAVPLITYSSKKIDGVVYKLQDSLKLNDKIPVSITRSTKNGEETQFIIQSHGKTKVIDGKSIQGEVLGFRVESRSDIDSRIVFQVLEKNGKMKEITYRVPSDLKNGNIKVVETRNLAHTAKADYEVASQASIKPRLPRAQGVK